MGIDGFTTDFSGGTASQSGSGLMCSHAIVETPEFVSGDIISDPRGSYDRNQSLWGCAAGTVAASPLQQRPLGHTIPGTRKQHGAESKRRWRE